MVIINYIGFKTVKNKNFNGILFGYDYSKQYFKIFSQNNLNHRYYGPAVIYQDNSKEWYFNGLFYSIRNDYNQKQFIKDLNKQWLY